MKLISSVFCVSFCIKSDVMFQFEIKMPTCGFLRAIIVSQFKVMHCTHGSIGESLAPNIHLFCTTLNKSVYIYRHCYWMCHPIEVPLSAKFCGSVFLVCAQKSKKKNSMTREMWKWANDHFATVVVRDFVLGLGPSSSHMRWSQVSEMSDRNENDPILSILVKWYARTKYVWCAVNLAAALSEHANAIKIVMNLIYSLAFDVVPIRWHTTCVRLAQNAWESVTLENKW